MEELDAPSDIPVAVIPALGIEEVELTSHITSVSPDIVVCTQTLPGAAILLSVIYSFLTLFSLLQQKNGDPGQSSNGVVRCRPASNFLNQR